MSSLIGRTLSHYQIVDEISRGGMGVVYRALDLRLNREVALKVLPADLVADAARRARFVQEAQAASALEHPHIAVIHEIDEADGISFIAMELVRGEKLSDLTARGPLAAGRALDLAVEVAEGLARAHDKAIVHRDLKPANVMLTEDGHAKVIDFGLAKLVDALSGDSDGATLLKAETDPGTVLGTVTYMSPEQARGGKVDHRSDIFSFGVLLHEMLTGRPPFRGNTGIDTMHAILHDPVPPLPPLGGAVSAEATHDVQRILDKCLAKDPAERYQGMRDIVVDIRAARRRLESSSVSTVGSAVHRVTTREGFQRVELWGFAAVALIVLLLAGFGALKTRWTTPAAPAPAAGDKPSVAVLYFENNTGNPQLDWLRTGLTDMLVTDLSQSPDVEVLGTDRLVQILTDMRRQDDRVMAFDTVQEIAKRAGVTSVLLGSYMKAGETIRINLKLQEASTGRIVTTERVEAAGEANLFPTMDDLTRRIKAKFSLADRTDPTRALLNPPTANTTSTGTSIDRDLREVTTSSIEAYRYYAEGINLHERFREQEAIPLLEKAVQIDPNFGLALIKLAVVHSNLGHSNQRDAYAKRAFERVDRMTARERHYIEGYYYSGRGETIAKAIEAYSKAVELYPDHASARNNLAVLYYNVEQYEDAIRHLEELRRRRFPFPGTHTNLARSYTALGRFDTGRQVLEDYLRQFPDNVNATWNLSFLLADAGKVDEAAAMVAKAEALDPGNVFAAAARRNLNVLEERWPDAAAIANKLRQTNDSFAKFLGGLELAEDALYRGRTADALRVLEQAAASEGAGGSNQTAGLRNFAAGLLLDVDRPALALGQAERALAEARGRAAENRSFALKARAQSRLGRANDASSTVDALTRKISVLPGERATRGVHLLAGVMALDRGDASRAIQDLKRAEALLAPHPVSPAPPHVEVWFALGSAHLAAKNDGEAAARFQRIVDSGHARIGSPLEFVRSLYFLGQISERKGDRAKAADYYRRFLQYWGDGEIDRERVAEARKKLAGT